MKVWVVYAEHPSGPWEHVFGLRATEAAARELQKATEDGEGFGDTFDIRIREELVGE